MKTLKFKMTLGVCLLFAAFLAAAALTGLSYFEQETLRSASAQQFTLVSSLADEIDSKILTAQKQLLAISRDIPWDLTSRPPEAQAFLDGHQDNLILFDNALSLFALDGTLVAVTPPKPEILGRNFSDRPYFKITTETGKPYISHPFASRQAGQPIVMFTAPVLGPDGEVTAVLGGSLNLLKNNFLGNISQIKIGINGYLYLITPERILLAHPDTDRILAEPVPEGANTLLDKAVKGFDGSGKTINSRGLSFLSSFKHLAGTGWILGANFPLEELEAPIQRAKTYFWTFLGVSLSAAVLCIWLFMSLVTGPLARLTRSVKSLAEKEEDFVPIPVRSRDEIGTLSQAFNVMASDLNEQKKNLHQQINFLNILIEAIPTPVFFKDAQGRYLGCNTAFENFIGVARDHIIGQTLEELVPGELAKNLQEMDADLLRQGPGSSFRTEREQTFPDGTPRHLLISKATFRTPEGTVGGLIGTLIDITDRRRMEESLREQKLFYENLLQNSAVPTFVIDNEHRVLIWNRACEQLTGKNAAELLGTSLHWSAFYETPRSCLADVILDQTQTTEEINYYPHIGPSALTEDGLEAEGWYPNLGGKARFVSFDAAPIRDSQGKIIAVIETLHDLTETKKNQESLRKLSRAIEQSPASVIITDQKGLIEYVNPKFSQVSGYSAEEALGANPSLLKSGETTPEAYQKLWKTILAGREWRGEFHNRRKDGSRYWESASISPVRNPDGEITHFVAVKEDITSSKLAQEMLRSSEERLRLLLESTSEGIFGVDLQGKCTFSNPAAARYLGFETGEDLFGRDMHRLVHGHTSPDEGSLAPSCPICDSIRREVPSQGASSLFLKADDTTLPVSFRANPIRQGQTIIGAVVSFDDISERILATRKIEESEFQLAYLRQYDPLTQLPNRKLFNELLNHAIAKARRSHRQVALLLLDLDRFQNINDSLGHEFGDQLLCQVAQRLKHLVRGGDTVSRFSGDEFALIMEEVEDLGQIVTVAKKILQSFTEELQIGELGIYTSASMGISLFPSDGTDTETLLKAADVAMFRAKEGGRNNYQFYKPEMNARSRELLLLEGSLRQALLQDQLILHYQPQIDLETGKVIGVEALVRWIHPELGMISPADFIPLAEESGLIVPIGAWVLGTACRQCKDWIDRGLPPIRMAVNISARQFREEGLLQTVQSTLSATGLNPALLELEITESTLMNNVDRAIEIMHEINALGVALSIDDFGTGYSSLSYLKRFPIHSLKIDRSFVRDITVDPNDAAIATSIIALAHSLSLMVIAEGIETEDQALFLSERHCDIAQGYLFSRPLCDDELTAYLIRQFIG